jgi:hypothetical protein
MRLQYANEKRSRFKKTGSCPPRHGIWPGKNHFSEKPVGKPVPPLRLS